MNFLNSSGKVLILLSLVFATSCDTFAAKPYPTLKPTATDLPALSPSNEATFAVVMTETPLPEPTVIHAAIPTVFGTPLPDYRTIPIPADAVTGTEIDDQYQFTSKRAPLDISNYYQQILPKSGWDIQQVSILEGDAKNATKICLALSQTSGPFQAIVCISKRLGEELTSVRITVYTTN